MSSLSDSSSTNILVSFSGGNTVGFLQAVVFDVGAECLGRGVVCNLVFGTSGDGVSVVVIIVLLCSLISERHDDLRIVSNWRLRFDEFSVVYFHNKLNVHNI